MGNPGLYIDFVPKDGGNRFSGSAFLDYTHEPWAWSNYSDELKARGINDVTRVYEISDINGGFGGPILRDKLWFYGALRYETLDVSVVDNYYDKDPTPYLYAPDFESAGPRQRRHPERVVPAHLAGDVEGQGPVLVHQPEQGARVLQHQRHRHAGRRGTAGDEVRAADHPEVDADADQPAAARGRRGGRAHAVPQRLS